MKSIDMRKIVRYSCGLITLLIVFPMFLSSCVAQTGKGLSESSAPVMTPTPPSVSVSVEAPNEEPWDKDETFFEGDWARTDVIRYASASLTITDETEKNFAFILTAYWGDHSGMLSGEATKISSVEAVYHIDAGAIHGEGTLRFSDFDDGKLVLNFEGDLNAMDFGQNVLPDGIYVKGEPEYESDGYPMMVFGDEATMERTKALIANSNEISDDTAYENLIVVMREGLPVQVGPGRYKGFLLPGNTMGADLYISHDRHIYLMAYGLDERPYVFYTTDVQYHGWLRFPEYLELPESVDSEEINFVYNGYNDEYTD